MLLKRDDYSHRGAGGSLKQVAKLKVHEWELAESDQNIQLMQIPERQGFS